MRSVRKEGLSRCSSISGRPQPRIVVEWKESDDDNKSDDCYRYS